MKISELIAKLQNQITIVGDIEVFSERRNEYGDTDEYSYMHPPIVFTTHVRRREEEWKIDHVISVVK